MFRATADVGLQSLIRNDVRALHFAAELPLGTRLQPICFGWARNALVRRANSKLLRGLRRGAVSRSLEVEITGSFSIVRACGALSVDEPTSWMDPPRVGSRGSSKFNDTHFIQREGALCEYSVDASVCGACRGNLEELGEERGHT